MLMNIVLIDDEQIALDYFQIQFKKIGHVNAVDTYINPTKGMQAIMDQDIDVVFLDVHMPGIDGVSLARRILEKKPHICIVFVTAYEQYAVDAFEIKAVDYLVKPVRAKRLTETIRRIQDELDHRQSEELVEQEPVLRVQLCKQLAIEPFRDSNQTVTWRTARVKELFILLLQNREQTVHKDQIVEFIWPDTDMDKASAQLYTTIYHVRRVLRQFGEHFQLKNTTNGYVLFTKDVKIDVDTWEDAMRKLPPLHKHTVHLYEEAMKYYSDSYLKDYAYLWAVAEQERLDQLWIKNALKIVGQYKEDRRDAEAFKWSKHICARYPDVEEAHFSLMQHFSKQGKSAYVQFQYERLVDSLRNELGVQPSEYVSKWYRKWKEQIGTNIE